MRAVVQKVTSSSVRVDGKTIGEIGKGFNVLVGISCEDTLQDLAYIEEKVAGLRVFADSEDKMNLSLKEIGGEILLISQFTLYGDARRGKRPSFIQAAKGEEAKKLFDTLAQNLRNRGFHVETGEFGAFMEVSIVNDGPVTILLDSTKTF